AASRPDKAQPMLGFFRFKARKRPRTPMNSAIKHFLNTQDWSRDELDSMLRDAAAFKRLRSGQQLAGRSIALVFFNSSLRTRTSFELGARQLGGKAIVLQPGKDAWPIEFELGSVM